MTTTLHRPSPVLSSRPLGEGPEPLPWWQTGTVYQVYPRSFMDANGDGTGDLPGITRKLGYLSWLGIDAIWLSPMFPSPMADFGYDVSNYTDVDPLFGTLADFDQLLAEAHGLGMKVLLDFVPNHTSDQHPWFQESRASRRNAKRDWYVWHDGAPGGGPPNNWLAVFGGSAWTRDRKTRQYYLHSFLPEQPDLNWRNPDVRRAMWDVMRFWLDRGVDGFRVDAIAHAVKDAQLRDNPVNPKWRPGDPWERRQVHRYNKDRPELHDVLREMRQVTDAYDARVLVGEIYAPPRHLVTHYGRTLDEFHLPFNFMLTWLPWKARLLRYWIDVYERLLPAGAWPNWVLSNHDRSRIATRIGAAQARVAQMLLLTLRGTPTMYYGDELGMHDVPIPHARVADPKELRLPGTGRDPERTPMQWDATPNAGFSSCVPWLPLADDYPTVNVAAQRADPHSMLSLVHRLLRLRRAMPALSAGGVQTYDAGAEDVLAYVRTPATSCDVAGRALVVLNLGARPRVADLSAVGQTGTILCATGLNHDGRVALRSIELRPNEGLVLGVEPPRT